MYLLIHTMVITECDFILEAQFYHAIGQIQDARLVRRMSLRILPLSGNRNKVNLQRLSPFSLKTLMKRNCRNIKHHLRTVKIVSQNNFINQQPTEEKSFPLSSSPTNSIEKVSEEPNAVVDDQISPTFSPQQITNWLTCHRFDKYLQTFTSFSGADMLRMSRDDLIQICGHADGIRLYNALHSKMITPMLTIYVSRDNKNIFSAVFLSSLSTNELVQKLANIISVTQDQIKDICVVGPKSIHVQLSSDVIKHIKDESMFNIDVLQDKGGYIIVLKPAQK